MTCAHCLSHETCCRGPLTVEGPGSLNLLNPLLLRHWPGIEDHVAIIVIGHGMEKLIVKGVQGTDEQVAKAESEALPCLNRIRISVITGCCNVIQHYSSEYRTRDWLVYFASEETWKRLPL